MSRFGFSANRMQETVKQIAAEMEKPGIMILEALMGQGKTEAALSAAEIMMNRFHLGGIAFFPAISGNLQCHVHKNDSMGTTTAGIQWDCCVPGPWTGGI